MLASFCLNVVNFVLFTRNMVMGPNCKASPLFSHFFCLQMQFTTVEYSSNTGLVGVFGWVGGGVVKSS